VSESHRIRLHYVMCNTLPTLLKLREHNAFSSRSQINNIVNVLRDCELSWCAGIMPSRALCPAAAAGSSICL